MTFMVSCKIDIKLCETTTIKTTNILEIRNTHYYTLTKVINLIFKTEGTDFFEIKKSMLICLIIFGTFPNAYGQRYC